MKKSVAYMTKMMLIVLYLWKEWTVVIVAVRSSISVNPTLSFRIQEQVDECTATQNYCCNPLLVLH